MNSAGSLGGIILAIVVAIVAASAVSRAQPDQPAATPAVASELLASDLIGRPVRSPNGEAVGEIADLVLSPPDKVSSAVVAIGRFLGIGERRVEMPFDKLVVAPDRSAVLVTMSKEQVAANPEFSGNDPQKRPTVAPPAPGPSNAPAGSVASPDPTVRAEANAEAEARFATDDPGVAGGIAENKAAYDKDKKEAPPQ